MIAPHCRTNRRLIRRSSIKPRYRNQLNTIGAQSLKKVLNWMSPIRQDLILVDRIGHFLSDPRSLTRDAERGLLVKLRRGVYVRSGVWAEARPRERHLLRVRSVLAAAVRPVTVSGISAAAVWGMPIAGEWPRYVTVLDEWRGGGRTEPGVKRTAAGFRTAEVKRFPRDRDRSDAISARGRTG